jgi:hypothetical protein
MPRHNGSSRPKPSRNRRRKSAEQFEPDKPPKQSAADRNLEWRMRSVAVPQPKENPDAR